MGNLRFTSATFEHVGALMADLRPLDRQEVEAAQGEVEPAVRFSLEASLDPVAAWLPDGSLVALFGVAPVTAVSDVGAIWLLGTTKMSRHPREVIACTRRYVQFTRHKYPVLLNYVDARNHPSVRWLRSVGFTIDPPAPFGRAGLPFHRFHMGLEDV